MIRLLLVLPVILTLWPVVANAGGDNRAVLIDLRVDAFCPSATHLVEITTANVDEGRFVTIIGQVHVNNRNWTDSGDAVTVLLDAGATRTVREIEIPAINGEHDYRVRVVNSDLLNSAGAVSNGVDCHAFTPTPTQTIVPTSTPVPPTATATSTATSIPPTASPTATSTIAATPTPTVIPTSTSTPKPTPEAGGHGVPTPTQTATSVPPTATVQPSLPAIASAQHAVSYEYVCLVSESDTNTHVDIIRTSAANGYLAEHPNSYRMPKQGACGPTDTEKVPSPTATTVVIVPTATEVPPTPMEIPTVEVAVVQVEATPTATVGITVAPTEEPTPEMIPVPVQVPLL